MIENYELCFYWQLDESMKYSNAAINFGKGVCLSNKFKIVFDEQSKRIDICPKPSSKISFYGEGVSSLTAIVGKNGAGKTTLLNKLRYDMADGQIHHYIIIFYSKIEKKFIVLDDDNLVNDIKINNFITGVTIEKIDSDSNKLKQYLRNTSFVYYNNQITSNMYWLRLSNNGIDISSNEPLAEYGYLEDFDGEKRAISVTIRSFANGLSGKLKNGDIVSVYVADYGDKKETLSPQELKYVEVLAVTLGTGYDTEETTNKEGEEKELPSTVTLEVNEEQAILLADLEANGKIHLAFVYRGDHENTKAFLEQQDKVFKEIEEAIDPDSAAEKQLKKEQIEKERGGDGH